MESFILKKENTQRNTLEKEGNHYCKRKLTFENGENSPQKSRDLYIEERKQNTRSM